MVVKATFYIFVYMFFFKLSLLYLISYKNISYIYIMFQPYFNDIFTRELHWNHQDRYDYCIMHHVTDLSKMYLAELINYAEVIQ